MSATNTVRVSFRKDASAEGWTYLTIEHVSKVAYEHPWITVVSESSETPGEDIITRFHEDTVAVYFDGTQEVTEVQQ